MRGRVGVIDISIKPATHDSPVMHKDGAHRDFADIERTPRRAQGFVHPQFVVFERGCVAQLHDGILYWNYPAAEALLICISAKNIAGTIVTVPALVS
jgi:hypothetical protein